MPFIPSVFFGPPQGPKPPVFLRDLVDLRPVMLPGRWPEPGTLNRRRVYPRAASVAPKPHPG